MSEERGRLRPQIVDDLSRAQEAAGEMFVGNERYTQLTLWDDGDYRVVVHHGFDTRRGDVHHGERIIYKSSEGDLRYQIVVKPYWDNERIIRQVFLGP